MNIKFTLKFLCVLSILFSVIGCSQLELESHNRRESLRRVETPKVVVPVNNKKTNYILTSVGYATIASQKGPSFDLKILNAMKASKIEAYKELTEQVHGVLVSAENNVQNSRLESDTIRSRVRGLVRGARVVRTYHEGDIYITELELDMNSTPFF